MTALMKLALAAVIAALAFSAQASEADLFCWNGTRYIACQPTNPLSVSGQGPVQAADATLTRPNNATGYTAGLALGSGASTIFTFTNILRNNGGTGYLTGVRMEASVASIATSNMGSVRCRIYNASPTSPPAADQAAAPTLVANSGKEMGVVDFSTWSIGGTGSDVIRSWGVLSPYPLQLQGAAASRNLYSVCYATGSFTPIANAIFNLYFGVTQN